MMVMMVIFLQSQSFILQLATGGDGDDDFFGQLQDLKFTLQPAALVVMRKFFRRLADFILEAVTDDDAMLRPTCRSYPASRR